MFEFANLTLTMAQTTGPSAGGDIPPVSGVAPVAGTTTSAPGAPVTTGPSVLPSPPGGFLGDPKFFLVLLIFLGGMWFMTSRSQRKERKRKQELLNSIKKGDKIETIGGVIGTVLEVREGDVVIESAGTRLRFRRSAVATVLGDKEPDSGTKN
jgi:preprotein translocase subunit YajC